MTPTRTPSDEQPITLFGGDAVLCRLPRALAHIEEQERDISRAIAKEHGIRFRDLAVLDLIARSEPKGIRTNTLARELSLSTSRLAHQIASLERRRLIVRAQHASDGRGVVITLAPAGRKLHTAAIATYRGVASSVLPAAPGGAPATAGLLSALEDGSQRWNEEFAGTCVVALSSAGTPAALVDAIGVALFERIGFSSLALVRPGKRRPELVATCELPGTTLARKGVTTGADGPAAQALASGAAIVCPTAAAFSEGFPGAATAAAKAGSPVGSAVAFPLTRAGRLVGALVASSPLPGVPDETALRALEAAGRACAIRLDLESAFAGSAKSKVAAGDSVLITGKAVAV